MVTVFLGVTKIDMVEELLAKLGLIYALIGDLLIPKLKPIMIGVFYRPQNENTFLEMI